MTDTDPRDPAADAGAADERLAPPLPELETIEPGDVHSAPIEGQPVDTEPVAVPRAGRPARAVGYLLAAIAGGAVVAVVLAVAWMLGGSSVAPTPGDVAGGGPSPSASEGPAGPMPVLGDAAAPVLVEVWADYQCPFCGVMAHAIEPSLLRDFVDTGRIRLAFRDFAFLGDESVEAAAAARCAGEQGAYWRYHDLLFASQRGENQGAFAPENLAQLAAFADLDTKAFATCMDARKAHGAALAQTEEGRALGVSSTPTFHIVGPKGETLLKGVTQLSKIETAIQQTIDGTVPSPTPEPAASGPASPAPSGAPAASPSAEPTVAP